jgi:uncharacterized membrane protein
MGRVSETEIKPFVWSQKIGVMTLPMPVGWVEGQTVRATAINNRGEVAGIWNVGGPVAHVLVWENGVHKPPRVLLLPEGYGGRIRVEDINERGWVVGRTENSPTGPGVPMLIADGVFMDLRELTGIGDSARAVNNSGVIVGFDGSSEPSGVRWTLR